MARVSGKVALVTGGAVGMGEAFSRMLAAEGAAVAVADINSEDGERTVEAINRTGGRAIFVKLDVSREDDWRRAVEIVETELARLDILVNNAGIFVPGTVETTSPEDWDRIFSVNSTGVYLGMRAAIPAMRRSGGGSIVNISSNWGIVGFPDAVAYCATKGAVRLMTKAVAADVAQDDIRVNSVHPSLTVTHLSRDIVADPVATKRLLGSSLLGRPAKPEEIAAGVVFLASDESRYMTGSELVIDGGYLAA